MTHRASRTHPEASLIERPRRQSIQSNTAAAPKLQRTRPALPQLHHPGNQKPQLNQTRSTISQARAFLHPKVPNELPQPLQLGPTASGEASGFRSARGAAGGHRRRLYERPYHWLCLAVGGCWDGRRDRGGAWSPRRLFDLHGDSSISSGDSSRSSVPTADARTEMVSLVGQRWARGDRAELSPQATLREAPPLLSG